MCLKVAPVPPVLGINYRQASARLTPKLFSPLGCSSVRPVARRMTVYLSPHPYFQNQNLKQFILCT